MCSFAIQEEEMIEELPPETLERLVRRPEDLPEKVGDNIRKYKTNMLRLLEVLKTISFFASISTEW